MENAKKCYRFIISTTGIKLDGEYDNPNENYVESAVKWEFSENLIVRSITSTVGSYDGGMYGEHTVFQVEYEKFGKEQKALFLSDCRRYQRCW